MHAPLPAPPVPNLRVKTQAYWDIMSTYNGRIKPTHKLTVDRALKASARILEGIPPQFQLAKVAGSFRQEIIEGPGGQPPKQQNEPANVLKLQANS